MGYFIQGQVYYNAKFYKFDFERYEEQRKVEDYIPKGWKKLNVDFEGKIVER